MKPRLRKICQMWFCRSDSVTGLGFTPSLAYDDWADLTRNHWRKV